MSKIHILIKDSLSLMRIVIIYVKDSLSLMRTVKCESNSERKIL